MNSVLQKCVKNLFSQTRLTLRFRNNNVKNNNYCTVDQEQKVTIANQMINYIKVGRGEKTLLCFPGALGTIWSDFKPQINQLNKELFTVVAFDPPGYGFSRPPNREFTLDFYEKDAVMAYKLMKELGIGKFSLLGWSDGGISSLILAAKYPDVVDKLVVWGANSYILPEDIEAFEKIRDTRHWSDRARAPLVALYGERGLQDMWSGWCDAMQAMHKRNGGNVCMESVARITCPTLVLHGARDPVVQPEHPNYLSSNIRHARMHIFPQGKHNIHLRYAEEFNAIVTDFIME